MTTEGLPLSIGAAGEAVRDLQRRLIAAGLDIGDPSGRFGDLTEAGVRRFQHERGLLVDGICGRDTWAAIVEAGYHLGDRLLYLRSPMLRGDDVGDLQRRLGALGFDAGRLDGIFGPDTERALKDFQRNAGLNTDGVCGPDVLSSFARLGAKTAAPARVAGIRERDRLSHGPRDLVGRRIVIGNLGGLEVPVAGAARALQRAGASLAMVDHPDKSVQAAQANSFKAELYLGLCVSTDGQGRTAYYGSADYESAGGRLLADVLAAELCGVFPEDAYDAMAMRLPVLRETRMPAVICYLGRVDHVVERAPQLADAVTAAITRWATEPLQLP